MILNEYLNKRTLIIGEVNSGKTRYLARILHLFKKNDKHTLAVIDMAPETIKGVGGKMEPELVSSLKYYTINIVAPRLVGKTTQETKKIAKKNAQSLEKIFQEYLKIPSDILFINDTSIYLQAGDLDHLITLLDSTSTVIMNGYYGTSLGGGEFGKREKRNMEALQKICDKTIKLIPSQQHNP